jgi:hypothetical protein
VDPDRGEIGMGGISGSFAFAHPRLHTRLRSAPAASTTTNASRPSSTPSTPAYPEASRSAVCVGTKAGRNTQAAFLTIRTSADEYVRCPR